LATASLASLNLPGVVDINGGQSTAATSILNGQTRQAQSTSSIGSVSILGGLIVLNGLHWTASQTTGAQNSHSGTFAISSVSVAGTTVPIPSDGLNSVAALINQTLATTGIHITLPTQTVGADGSVQETALSIGLDDSELGKELVSPFIPGLQPLRSLLNSTLVEIDPTLGESDLVLEIALSILAGQGTLDLNLGGAYATTNGTVYSNPLGGDSSLAALGAGALPDLGGAIGGDDTQSPLLGSPSNAAGTPTTTATSPPNESGPTKLALQRLGSSSNCQSTSGGSCRSPHSVVIVICLAALTLGLLGLESLRMRRRKRLLLPEES
jgi:hypothetical protein